MLQVILRFHITFAKYILFKYYFYRNAQGNIKCHLLEAAHTPIAATVPPTLVAPHGYGGANGIGSLGKEYMCPKDIL